MTAKFKAAGVSVIPDLRQLRHPNAEPVVAPVAGTLLWEFDYEDKSYAPAPGKEYKKGDYLCAIQTSFNLEIVYAPFDGVIVEATKEQGARIAKNDTIAFIEKF